MAGAGAGDLDDDLAGAGCRNGNLGDDGIAMPGLELECTHRIASREALVGPDE
jgi:hypothetical protein